MSAKVSQAKGGMKKWDTLRQYYRLDTFQILRIVRLTLVRNSSNSEMDDGCVDPHCVLCTLEMKDGDVIVFGRQIPHHLANPSRQNKNNTLSPIQGRPASSRGQVLFMHNNRLSTPRWPGAGMPLGLRRTGPGIIRNLQGDGLGPWV